MSEIQYLRIGAFLPHSRVNGPGLRSVLWVQGCDKRCEDCFNPDFWDYGAGQVHTVNEVAQWILDADKTQGVTFSGGEPFAQAAALVEVAARTKNAGKSIVIFTGFTHSELCESNNPTWKNLLFLSDLLICGPYKKDDPGSHPLLSSANQELIFQGSRYQASDFEKQTRRVEFRIQPGGDVVRTGFPKESFSGDFESIALNPPWLPFPKGRN
jgi:anaerobic ribonucleoside-triphosphate reductase activating protein